MGVSTSIYTQTTAALMKSYLGTDEKQDFAPSNSAVYDVRSEDWNKIVAALAEVAMRTRLGNLCVYTFSVPDATASQTSVAMYRESGADTTRTKVIAPWAGSVVGLAVYGEGARTAGTLTIKWGKNGTEQTLSVVIDGSNTQKNYATQLPAVEAFAAGDELTCTFTTDGSWAAGATPSVSVDLLVAYGS